MFKTLAWTRDDENRGRYTGTFGEVHVWNRLKNGVKEVAVIKIPTVPQHIEKLKRERDKMLKVNHVNIVKCLDPNIFGADFDMNKCYQNNILWRDVLVMEYCDGGNLRKVFNKNKQGVGLAELQHICHDLGSALQYLHETHHNIHRDIKPENVLMKLVNQKDGRQRSCIYKLGDLGEVTEIMKSDGMTHISTLRTHGTFAYMAPEQLLQDPYDGTLKMGESTDLWGFATILSEAAFGIRPYFHSHGHQIHTDINYYCSNLLKKADTTIFIYKDGSLRDSSYPSTHLHHIPHSGTLPEPVTQRVYSILRSCLRADRKRRGDKDPATGHYKVYDDIIKLSQVELCQVVYAANSSTHWKEGNASSFTPETECTAGMLLHEDLTVAKGTELTLKPGLQVFLTDETLPPTVPAIPYILELYFSEPFPASRRLVEKSILGYAYAVRHHVATLQRCCHVAVTYLQQKKACSSPGREEEDIRIDVTAGFEKCSDDMLQLMEYVSTWSSIFSGLTPQQEWTDVYILIDAFRQRYTNLVEIFARACRNLYGLLRRSDPLENLKLLIKSHSSDGTAASKTPVPKNDQFALALENAELVRKLAEALSESLL